MNKVDSLVVQRQEVTAKKALVYPVAFVNSSQDHYNPSV